MTMYLVYDEFGVESLWRSEAKAELRRKYLISVGVRSYVEYIQCSDAL